MDEKKIKPNWIQKFKDGLQISLLLFGTLFGIYQFIYKDIIVPSKRPPAVTLTATLDEMGRADGMILVRAHLVVANRGEAKVWVPALWWQVVGVSFNGEDRGADQYAKDVRPLLERGEESVARYSSIKRVDFAASGRVPDYELWYQPKDETVHEQLFLVPEKDFDVLQMYAYADITKSIAEFAPTRWDIDATGQLNPTLLVKQSGWSKDYPERVLPFEPEKDAAQRKQGDKNNAGQTFTTASLMVKANTSPPHR
jgi:hypothetical protein